ncbi:hypothetical protein IFR04_012542, partial [Cadophora malorum]
SNTTLTSPLGLKASENEGTGLEEWETWMSWESGASEHLPPVDLVESTVSTLTAADIGDLDTSGSDIMSALYPNTGQFSMDDATFELDDTSLPSTNSAQSLECSTCPLPTIYSAQNQQRGRRRSFRGVSSLTIAEEKALKEIAMPCNTLSNIKVTSAATFSIECQSPTSSSGPSEPKVRSRKINKRKSVNLEECSSAVPCQSRKRGHNAIEKKYRTNLNEKIESLREGVPSWGVNTNTSKEDSDVEDGKAAGQQKYGKAVVLTRALDYIQHLEGTTQRLSGEVDILKSRIGAFEKLAMSGSNVLNGNGVEVMNRPALTETETLKSIQSVSTNAVQGKGGRRAYYTETQFQTDKKTTDGKNTADGQED